MANKKEKALQSFELQGLNAGTLLHIRRWTPHRSVEALGKCKPTTLGYC